VEPDPLKPEAGDAGPVPLGYAGPVTDEPRRARGVGALMGFLFVLACGLLLAGIVVGLLGDGITGGTTGLDLWAIVLLLFPACLFTWGGALGLRYLYFQWTRRPLPPTTSRATRSVRRLFHLPRGG
jgi:hypothetical protein